MTIVGKDSKTMDELLKDGEWNIYYVSSLYKFQHDRDALTTDATDLLAFLRRADASQDDLKPYQGVSVSVRSNDDMAIFSVQEQVAGTGGSSSGQFAGAFVYFTPREYQGNPSGNAPQLLLLRGNERLVTKVCEWVQHRYQCIVALQSLRIRSVSMEQFAQSLFLNIASQADEDETTAIHTPLKLTLRNEAEAKVVHSVTVSIPYLDIQAKYELQRERRNTLVEQDRMIRSLVLPYCSQLSEDMGTYSLAAVSCDECELDSHGILRILRTDRLTEIFTDLLDIFTEQEVTIPETLETTL
ncbi:hypothetical protein H310_12792 [Aphanomyces invadans]|uniref:Uncharacterized protein n=1 Tax=Aphanomyces invadans TaxID=157072 RepID=A0A024TGK6_9STRA|nr:hypothetical protein H310_12792 [Aphanomyces invadans]ETV93188.1 hypothetical protein H310_12792 [Aphanomyces invadans]|eukprot:XP_008878210.1 hypothetical protein H310_12792 [Aphanomyces invadans]